MLNSLIKEAAILGTDSIGITNGQIQADRYEGQGDEESEPTLSICSLASCSVLWPDAISILFLEKV